VASNPIFELTGGKKMAEKKESEKGFNTCLENPFMVEMMQKMLGQEGIGSLCTKMMKQVMEKSGNGGSSPCAEMMGSMLKGCCVLKEKSKETKEEESHG
jgi:hypothetical protein